MAPLSPPSLAYGGSLFEPKLADLKWRRFFWTSSLPTTIPKSRNLRCLHHPRRRRWHLQAQQAVRETATNTRNLRNFPLAISTATASRIWLSVSSASSNIPTESRFTVPPALEVLKGNGGLDLRAAGAICRRAGSVGTSASLTFNNDGRPRPSRLTSFPPRRHRQSAVQRLRLSGQHRRGRLWARSPRPSPESAMVASLDEPATFNNDGALDVIYDGGFWLRSLPQRWARSTSRSQPARRRMRAIRFTLTATLAPTVSTAHADGHNKPLRQWARCSNLPLSQG